MSLKTGGHNDTISQSVIALLQFSV